MMYLGLMILLLARNGCVQRRLFIAHGLNLPLQAGQGLHLELGNGNFKLLLCVCTVVYTVGLGSTLNDSFALNLPC